MTLFRYLCIYCIICATKYYAVAYEKCELSNGVQGYCSNIHHCESAKAELKLRLKPTLCRFERSTPIVCCLDPVALTPGIETDTSTRNRVKFEEAATERNSALIFNETYTQSTSTSRSINVIKNTSSNKFHNTFLVSFPEEQNFNPDNSEENSRSEYSPSNIFYQRYPDNSRESHVQFQTHSLNPYVLYLNKNSYYKLQNSDKYSYSDKPIKFDGLSTDILKIKAPTNIPFRFPQNSVKLPSKVALDGNSESSTATATISISSTVDEQEETTHPQEELSPTALPEVGTAPPQEEVSPMTSIEATDKNLINKHKVDSVTNPDFSKIEKECNGFIEYGSQFVPRTTYITNGVSADHYEFPHMAALGYNSKNGMEWKCGGSLITDEFVITAAHCTYSRDSGPIKEVRLGDIQITRSDIEHEEVQTFQVLKTFVHPLYKPSAHYHDIAILQLDRRVNFSRAVIPGCLQTTHDFGNVTLWATGWGTEYSGGDNSQVLQKVDLRLFSAEDCFKIAYGRQRRLSDGVVDELQICAGYPEQNKDTCQGDSGGPLQLKMSDNINIYKIVGITSFGKKCEIVPGIYTRVSHYLPWIQAIVWPT